MKILPYIPSYSPDVWPLFSIIVIVYMYVYVLEGVTLLEEESHWHPALSFPRLTPFPISSVFYLQAFVSTCTLSATAPASCQPAAVQHI